MSQNSSTDFASSSLVPAAPVFPTFSDPARSTRYLWQWQWQVAVWVAVAGGSGWVAVAGWQWGKNDRDWMNIEGVTDD
jgi:hypothetical protein